MTRFNTGNPVGSADPRDRHDNSQAFDEGMNSESSSFNDRLGRARKSWQAFEDQVDQQQSEFNASQADREQRFNTFIASSGYRGTGPNGAVEDYTAGIEITEYNQIIRDSSGEFWRVSGSTELPYTTTGAGLPEGGAFVGVGDAVLRQELGGSPADGFGAALVGGAILSVGSMQELLSLTSPTDGLSVYVQQYHSGTGVGGGLYKWSATEPTSNHNGGSVINPARPYPADFSNDTNVISWLNPVDTGLGAWVLVGGSELNAEQFGVRTDGTGDQARLANAWLKAAAGKVATWSGTIRIGSALEFLGAEFDGTTLQGDGTSSIIKPEWKGPTEFQDVIKFSSCSGLTLRDFHIDGSEWVDNVAYIDRGATQWAKITLSNIANLTVSNVSGYAVGNMLNLKDCDGFFVSNVRATDATLIVHILNTTKNGTISDVRGDRIRGSVVDFGSSGDNITATNVYANGNGDMGGRETGEEAFDIGGGKNITISNCVLDFFLTGVQLKGEGGKNWEDVSITNCQFLRCKSRGLYATPGDLTASPLETFGGLSVTGCTFSTSEPADLADYTSAYPTGFIDVRVGRDLCFKNNIIQHSGPREWAVYVAALPGSVDISSNTVVSNEGGIHIPLTAKGLGGSLALNDNVVTYSASYGLNLRGMSVVDLSGNYFKGSTSDLGGLLIDTFRSLKMSRNTVDSSAGHGIHMKIRSSDIFDSGTVELIPAPQFCRLSVENNEVVNHGLGPTFRQAYYIELAGIAGDVYGGRLVGNHVKIDTVNDNSQGHTGLSGAATGQLKNWVFTGNTGNRGVSGATAAAFDPSCTVENVFLTVV